MEFLLTQRDDRFSLLEAVRQWLDGIEIRTLEQATWLCRLIPASCPFARTITVFGRALVTIPPLCKLNPVYEQLMMLRFRALSHLAQQTKIGA
jgi:Mo-dependent nitrogenase C-terminus